MSNYSEMEDGVHAPTESALPTEIPDLVALLEFQEQIVQVCQKLKTLIDPTDDLYVVQKSLANEGIVPIFVELLSSVKNAEQLIELCETVGVLCANIEGVATRKRSGLESGFQERSFNPVQNELAEYNGFRKLVDLLDSDLPGVSDAANQTLTVCCSYNHSNKVAYLYCLVHDLLENKKERLEQINALVSTLEIRDDVVVLLDQVIRPLLGYIEDEDIATKREALFLMGAICEGRPATAVFLCEEGALPPVVQIILTDDVLSGKAIQVLWQLVRTNKKLLDPEKDRLQIEGVTLIKPLLSIIKSTASDAQDKGETEQEDSEEDYSDEALLILKALAEQDEEVRKKAGDLVEPETSRCSLM